MNKVLSFCVLFLSLGAFANEEVKLQYEGIKNKQTGNIIAAQCGQLDLEEDECQFVYITRNSFNEKIYRPMAGGRTFTLERLNFVMQHYFNYEMKHSKREWYKTTRFLWENAVNAETGIEFHMSLLAGLLTGVSESIYYGLRAPVALIKNQAQLNRLKKGENVVKVSNEHFQRLYKLVEKFKDL